MNDEAKHPGNEPFGRIPRWIAEDAELMASLNKSEFAVVMQVCVLLAPGTWTAFITNATLSKRCGINIRTARRSVQRLIDLGVLTRPRRGRLAFCLSPNGGTDAPILNTKGGPQTPIQEGPQTPLRDSQGGVQTPLRNSQGGLCVRQRGSTDPREGGPQTPHSRSIIKNLHQEASALLKPFDFSPEEAAAIVDRLGDQAVRDVVDSVRAAGPGEIRNPAGWVRSALERVAAGTFELDVRVKAKRRVEREGSYMDELAERRRAEYEAAREAAARDAAARAAAVAALSDAEFDDALQQLRREKKGTFEGTLIEKAVYEGNPREHRAVLSGISDIIARKETVGA
ncbi:MAG: helix-turn-helix domain-containing protein [Phycisphaerales bacterium JB065]